jgi:hypothetical protein
MVAGGAFGRYALDVFEHCRLLEHRGGRVQQGPAGARRRFARFSRELYRREPLVRSRDQFQIEATVTARRAMSAGEGDSVRGRDTEADAVAQQRQQRRPAAGRTQHAALRERLETVGEGVAAAGECGVAQLQDGQEPRESGEVAHGRAVRHHTM